MRGDENRITRKMDVKKRGRTRHSRVPLAFRFPRSISLRSKPPPKRNTTLMGGVPFWRRWRDSNSRALLRRLPHFECGPFNRLGTSPNIKLCACALREMLSGGHRFTEHLLCHTFSCFAREKRRRGRKGPIFKKMIGKLKNFLDISRISYIIIWLAVCRQILALI